MEQRGTNVLATIAIMLGAVGLFSAAGVIVLFHRLLG